MLTMRDLLLAGFYFFSAFAFSFSLVLLILYKAIVAKPTIEEDVRYQRYQQSYGRQKKWS